MFFCCFEAFFWKFTENIYFYSKYDYLRKEHRKTKKICFSLRVWKGAHPEEILDLFKHLFLIKPLKGTDINKNFFYVVLKHFRGNSQRTSLFSPKSDSLRKEHRNTKKVCFFNKFERGQILRKIWICLNQWFWSNH